MPIGECNICHRVKVVHWRTGICPKCKERLARKKLIALSASTTMPKRKKQARRVVRQKEVLGPELVQKEKERKCLDCGCLFRSVASRLCDTCNERNQKVNYPGHELHASH